MTVLRELTDGLAGGPARVIALVQR